MKVETRELPDSVVEFSFEIEEARVERAMDAAYRRMAPQVNIAGFRRGKAPRGLVERVLGRESILEEALHHLLPEVYEEALRETKFQALTDPQFDVEGLNPLRAKATVVVQPTVVLGDYRAVHREQTPVEVADSEVDAVLAQLRESHAEWVPVERAAQLGDRVAIDVTGVSDGRTVIEQEDVEYVLLADSEIPVPGFAEQLVGIKAGESRSFTLPVARPTGGAADADADPEESVPDARVIAFDVTAKDVKEKELPELDDYFATVVGSFADLSELRRHLEAQLRAQAEAGARRALEEGIIGEVVESATLTVPEKLVAQQAQRSRDRLVRELDTQGLAIEQYLRIIQATPEAFESQLKADSEQALRRSFVLRAIGAAEGFEVTEADIDASIRAAMAADGGDARTIGRALRQPEIRERVRLGLIEQRAAQWLVEHALGPARPGSEGSGEQES